MTNKEIEEYIDELDMVLTVDLLVLCKDCNDFIQLLDALGIHNITQWLAKPDRSQPYIFDMYSMLTSQIDEKFPDLLVEDLKDIYYYFEDALIKGLHDKRIRQNDSKRVH